MPTLKRRTLPIQMEKELANLKALKDHVAKQDDAREDIVPTDDGATASKAYEKGEFFFHNGDFCKAKVPIAKGARFTLNTNYEVTNMAEELFAVLNKGD